MVKCPICEKGILKEKIINEEFEYKGFTVVISNYITYECSYCKESIVDEETLKRSGEVLKKFKEEVDKLDT